MMHRLHIFIPATDKSNGNAIAKNIFPDTGEDKTFGTVQLKALGDLVNVTTHYACNGLATDDQRSKLLKALTNPGIGAIFYRVNLETEKLEATNSLTAAVGEDWSWEKSLADMKLENLPINPSV